MNPSIRPSIERMVKNYAMKYRTCTSLAEKDDIDYHCFFALSFICPEDILEMERLYRKLKLDSE